MFFTSYFKISKQICMGKSVQGGTNESAVIGLKSYFYLFSRSLFCSNDEVFEMLLAKRRKKISLPAWQPQNY